MKTQITVRRPNGQIETVIRDGGLSKEAFEFLKQKNREAGRGELLSFVEILDEKEKQEIEDLKKIGAERKRYQNLYNEGCDESYNPFDK